MLGYHDEWLSLTRQDLSRRVYGAFTSANYFTVLGVKPFLGRAFLPEEEGLQRSAPIAILSYSLWQTDFAADPFILGKIISVNSHSFTVVGVTPKGFLGCKTGVRTDIWFPLSAYPALHREWIRNRASASLNV